ncbi:CGNR zinc finger domain-containing protein [Streptomyces sp. NPDC087844]|uniref:CGNR zinc finger domain-containing protein n=1 Tax=Streptomyces sp. NPDC087844 TaxID=3365805 RepID=UPI003816DF72
MTGNSVPEHHEYVLQGQLLRSGRCRPALSRCSAAVRLLALEATELLAGPLAQLRRCQGPGCGWFFLDRSRSHTRQWCRSGDCGNRERVRRHYERSRGSRD